MPSEIFSQIFESFKVANVVIDYLKHTGIKFDRSAILDHDNQLLRFRYGLQLGAKSTRTEEFARKVKAKLASKLEIAAANPPMVTTLPNLEDVSPYVVTSGSSTTIDIGEVLDKVSSEILVIEFVQQLTPLARDHLFPIPHSFRNPIYGPNKVVEIPVEMITDYGSFWHKPYDSFVIRNVKKEGGVHYLEQEILQLVPEEVKKTIVECQGAKTLSSQVARQLTQIAAASAGFRAFANDLEIREQLTRAVTTDKPKNVIVLGVRGSVREMDIKGHKIVIPHEIIYTIALELEGKELAASAKIFMDIAQVDEIVRNLANKTF
jgi:hypothetical protein